MIVEIIASLLLLTGAILMLLAALGVFRLPDIYTRMHAATKSSSLGLMVMLAGVNVYYFEIGLLLKSILIVIFVFATNPVATHMIGGAAHFTKVKKWEETVVDEWEEDMNGEV